MRGLTDADHQLLEESAGECYGGCDDNDESRMTAEASERAMRLVREGRLRHHACAHSTHDAMHFTTTPVGYEALALDRILRLGVG
jgi:hypothetical protein